MTKNKFAFDLNMKKGLASFESGKIGKLAPKVVHFRVPEGTIGIRGTKFYVEVK
ncbi:MAG: FecR domain-containing protein [Epsilonproteobacteria bacterium]|nr:FecR domain-containing protein [Campylobacterota bacterium]